MTKRDQSSNPLPTNDEPGISERHDDGANQSSPAANRPGRMWTRRDPGQATTEYALVLVGAAVVALLVVAWATEGGGAGRIGELFDTVLSGVLDRANSVPIDGE